MTLSGNRGEWSETYVLLRLLARGHLNLASSDLADESSKQFGVESVIPKRLDGPRAFRIEVDHVILESGEKVERGEINHAADIILERLQSAESGTSITIPDVEALLVRLRILQLSAGSSAKEDITLQVLDPYLHLSQTLDFSIKSMMGSPATLLNASKATNFRFDLIGDRAALDSLSELDRQPVKLITRALELGVKVQFVGPTNATFNSNLMMVDTAMPQIIGSLLLAHYSGASSNIFELTKQLAATNPTGVPGDIAAAYYPHKIKTLLADCALGLTPSKPWTGTHSSNGGYIVVDQTGELNCLHAFERDTFNDYLLKSTRLERGSTSKHGYGRVVSPDSSDTSSHPYVLLNLQIRFIS